MQSIAPIRVLLSNGLARLCKRRPSWVSAAKRSHRTWRLPVRLDRRLPQLLAIRLIGLTMGRRLEVRYKPMTDEEITTAFHKLHHLHSTSGEAVGQFGAIGAI